MRTAPLADVCQIMMGQAPKGDSYNDSGEGVPLIAGAGDFGELHPKPKKFTTARGVRLSNPGDVIVGIRASIGDKVLSDGVYCLGRGVAGLRPGAHLDGRYLWNWVGFAAPELAAKGRGATFLQVNKTDIEEMEIPLPPIEEQRRIAAVLDAADALRAKRRQALAKLDTLTQAIFIDMFGDPESNVREWDRVAVGTVTTKVGSGATPRGGSASYRADGVSLIRSMNVHDGRFTWDGLAHIDDAQAQALDGVAVQPGDVLLNITGASVARVCLAPAEVLPARVNQHVAIVRPDPTRLRPTFLAQTLVSGSVKRRLLRIAESGATRQAITKDQISSLVLIVPPMEKQLEFEEATGSIAALKLDLAASVRAIEHLFASLQQRAFRGEL